MTKNSKTPFGDILGFVAFTLGRFYANRSPQIASSLTFTTLLSLVPIFTIVLGLVGNFPVFEDWSVQLKSFILQNLVPDVAGKVITVYMGEFADNAAKLTTIGLLFLLVTALTMMYVIEESFNDIWRVKRPRRWISRALLYWATLTIGPLLIGASLSVTSWLVTLSLEITQSIPGAALMTLHLVPLVLTIVSFSLLYLFVPNHYVPKKHALIGGVTAGLLFELMKYGFGVYITRFPTYTLVYGAFASLPIFLLWLYLSWINLLIGANLTAALSYWHNQGWRLDTSPMRQFSRGLQLLRCLFQEHQQGRSLSIKQLRFRLRIGLDEVTGLLDTLAAHRIVAQVRDKGWVLVRDPDKITVEQVFQALVLPGWVPDDSVTTDALQQQLRTWYVAMMQHLQITLRALFEQELAAKDINDSSATEMLK